MSSSIMGFLLRTYAPSEMTFNLSLFRHSCVTLKITVRDGHPRVIEEADFVTKRKGGEGIMLEVCELLNGVNQ